MDYKVIGKLGFNACNKMAMDLEALIVLCQLAGYDEAKLIPLREMLYEVSMEFFNNSNLSREWLQEK